MSSFNETPPETPPVFPSANGSEEAEEAHFDEVNSNPATRRKLKRPGTHVSRRQLIIGFFIIAILLALSVALGGKHNNSSSSPRPATNTTNTNGTVAPAVGVAPTSATGKTSSTAATGAGTGAVPATSVPATSTTPSKAVGAIHIPTVHVPTNSELGLPTPLETAEAAYALAQVKSTLELNYNVGSYVSTAGALECINYAHTKYAVQIISHGKPRPFIGKRRGQVVAAFGNKVGFVIIYASAGKIGLPNVQTIKVRSSHFRYHDSDPYCKLSPAGLADLKAPALH